MRQAIGVLLAVLTLAASAQPVQVQLILRSPAPGALSTWATDPSIVQIILRNTTATLYDGAIVSFTISRLPAGTTVARSKDFHPLQPRITIPPNGTVVLNGPQIIHESAIKIEDEALRQQAQAIGQLPEGTYQFCVRLLDVRGQEIGSTGAICPQTVVMLPDPPMLIHPRNDSTLAAGAQPMFIWAPVTGAAPSVGPITYTLRVVPLFPGQAPQDALDRNAPVINASGLSVPLYQYVPTDIPFTAFPQAIGFVWQVSALDIKGRPATRNNGKSEIFRFRFAPTMTGAGVPSDTTTRQPSGDTLTLTGGTQPIDTGSIVRRIELPGGFMLVVRGAISCTTSPCTISGSGSLWIPLLGDSVVISFDDIVVSRPTAAGTARLVSGALVVPLNVIRQYGLLTLRLGQLTISSSAALLDGAWIAQWSQWGWGCRNADSVAVRLPLSVTGIERQQVPLPVPWTCDGSGLLVGPCFEVRLDTLDGRIDVDTAQHPPRVTPYLFGSGEVVLPCLVSGGTPLRAALRLRLSGGKADLIAVLQARIRDARVLGMPQLRADADTLVLDLSDEVNPRNVPPAGLCNNPAWHDTRWRGIYVPNLRARLQVGDDTLVLASSALFDQGNGQKIRVSMATVLSSPDTLTIGGFAVRVDSVTVRICQGTLQSISARGTVIPPAALRRPSSWTALDSITIRLAAYDDGTRWRWNGVLTLRGGLQLRFGSLALLTLRDGTLEILDPPQGARRGYIEFSHLTLQAPATNPTGSADFYGLRIWNTGEIELAAAEGWMDISRWANLTVANLTVQAQEIGLGYGARAGSDQHWWVGFSGGLELDAEAALPSGGNGFRVRRLRIWDDGAMTSEGAYVNTSIAGAFRLSGMLTWGDQRVGSIPVRGLLGRLTGQFECLGGLNAQVDFALGSADTTNPFRFWFFQGAAAVPGGVPIVPGAFHLVGGLLGAGWHVRLDGYRRDVITEAGLSPPPAVVPDRGVDLLLRGGLVFADPALQVYRLSATTSLAFGRSTQLDLDGSLALLPQIRLATGTAWASYTHTASSMDVSLGGSVQVNFLNTPLFSAGASATFGSGGSCLQLGPLSREWIIADMEESFGSDILGVAVVAKGFVRLGELRARLCPTQGELYGNISGAIVAGAKLSVGGVQLPHHGGLGVGTEFCARYFYRFWREGSRFRLTARAGGGLNANVNLDYSGYPWGHYTQAYDHVGSYNGSSDFVDLRRHWSACGGSHCTSAAMDITLRGLFQADASIGALPLQVGSTTVYLPSLASARADVNAGYYVRATFNDKAFAKKGGSLASEAEALSCGSLDQLGSSATQENANEIPPPRLVRSSVPARGDTGIPVTACIRLHTGARLWAFPGSGGNTRVWKISTITARLEQLSNGGSVVRTVPLAQSPGTPPIAGSDTITYYVSANSSYSWHVLLPATRYRFVVEGNLESNDGQRHQGRDTIDFRTTSNLAGLELVARTGRAGTLPLAQTISFSLDTLVLRYPVGTEGNRVVPLEFGRDLWVQVETPTQQWRWTGSPNALVRNAERWEVLGINVGTEFHIDTSLLQPWILPPDEPGMQPRLEPLPITIRVLNAAAHGSNASRPSEAAAFLAVLPAEVARFSTSYAPPGSVSTRIATALQWQGAPLPRRAGLPGETAEPTTPVEFSFLLRNNGSNLLYAGTPFELRIGAYVRLPDGTTQYVIERRNYWLPQALPPFGEHRLRHVLALPTGSSVVGIDATLLPLQPFTEQDGTANNRVVQGQLPPVVQQPEEER